MSESEYTLQEAIADARQWTADIDNAVHKLNGWRPAMKLLLQHIDDLNEVLEDKRRLTRELDVVLNGDGAAASLCDIVGQAANGGLPVQKRYEKLRKVTPIQFLELWNRNMLTNIPFDDLVDQL